MERDLVDYLNLFLVMILFAISMSTVIGIAGLLIDRIVRNQPIRYHPPNLPREHSPVPNVTKTEMTPLSLVHNVTITEASPESSDLPYLLP